MDQVWHCANGYKSAAVEENGEWGEVCVPQVCEDGYNDWPNGDCSRGHPYFGCANGYYYDAAVQDCVPFNSPKGTCEGGKQPAEGYRCYVDREPCPEGYIRDGIWCSKTEISDENVVSGLVLTGGLLVAAVGAGALLYWTLTRKGR